MIYTEPFEKIELADLWMELIYSGVHVTAHDYDGLTIRLICKPRKSDRFSFDGKPLDVLRKAVNHIRKLNDQASLEDDLERIQETADKHMSVPYIELGKDAKCTCGSVSGLNIEGVKTYVKSWADGRLYIDRSTPTKISEYGQCPDCKQTYKITR